MFGIGFTEFLIILIFGFLIFGPDKLPKIAKTIGHAIGKFRAIQKQTAGTVSWKDFLDPENEDPFKSSLEAAEKMKDVVVSNAKDIKDDVKDVASETSSSLKDRKDELSDKKAAYEAKKAARDKQKAVLADENSNASKRAKYDEKRKEREALKTSEKKEATESVVSKRVDSSVPEKVETLSKAGEGDE